MSFRVFWGLLMSFRVSFLFLWSSRVFSIKISALSASLRPQAILYPLLSLTPPPTFLVYLAVVEPTCSSSSKSTSLRRGDFLRTMDLTHSHPNVQQIIQLGSTLFSFHCSPPNFTQPRRSAYIKKKTLQ